MEEIMTGLLYKELVLHKKNLLYMALGELLLSSVMILPLFMKDDFAGSELVITSLSTLLFLMMFLIWSMLTTGLFERDETRKWAYFISSSPLTQEGQVKAKYLFTLLLYAALFLWCYFLMNFAAVFGCTLNLMAAFGMLCLMLLANAIEFPFLVRFGSQTGSRVKTALAAFVMLIAFEYLLFGDTAVLSDPDRLFRALDRLSDTSSMPDAAMVIMAALPYLSAALYYLSCRLSCRLYLKGVEEYD